MSGMTQEANEYIKSYVSEHYQCEITKKAIEYIKSYVSEHYAPPKDQEDDQDDIDMYVDKWIDNFGLVTHNFPVITSVEIVDMMNYCNTNNEFHDFTGHVTVKDITNIFLSTVLIEEKLI
jgi:hypothetical protein